MDTNHDEIMRTLGNLEGKMDGVIARLDKINGSVRTLYIRTDNLAQFDSNLRGRVAIIGFIISIIVSVSVAYVNAKWF